MKGLPFGPNSDEVHFVNAGHAFKSAHDGDKPRFLKPLAEIGNIRREDKNTALAEFHIMKSAILIARRLEIARVIGAGEGELAASC